MPWIQLKISAKSSNAEQVSTFLSTLGAISVTFQDKHDVPIFEPLPGEIPLWANTEVIALFDAETAIDQILSDIKSHPLFAAGLTYQLEQIEDKDWVREWMDSYHPIKFGQRLWICPSWRDVPDPNAVNVMLDPGLAFGTGTHPTTSLCLTWLDSLSLAGKTVIDFGCGSGILAIAALKLGAKYAIGIDIDPQAIQASRDNARRNNVSESLQLYLPHELPSALSADIVIANILAAPLKSLSVQLRSLVNLNGKLGLSGLLTQQADEISTYYPDTTPFTVTSLDEWCLMTGVKHSQNDD